MVICVNLSCVPHRAIWDLTVRGKCFEKLTLDLAAAVMALITDLLVLVLPHRVIWQLHISTRKKLGVSAIFCLGLFSCVAAAVRLPTTVVLKGSSDVTYHYSAVAFWAVSEYTSGMLVLCGPSIPKVFEQFRKSGTFASLRSWMGTDAQDSLRQPQKPHAGHIPHAKPGMYQQIDPQIGNVPLARLKQTNSGRYLPPDDGAILLTTEFSATEDRESHSTKKDHGRQHPWMETRV